MGLSSTVTVVLGVFEPVELQEKRSFLSNVRMPSCDNNHVNHGAHPGEFCKTCGGLIDTRKETQMKQYHLPEEVYGDRHAFKCEQNQLGRVVIGLSLQRIDPGCETGAWELDLTQEVMKACVEYLWTLGITERPKLYLVSEMS